MTDLSRTIAPKSDQLNSDDLIAGPRTIRITRVSANEGNAEQPINVFFEGDDGKPYRPCKSMRRVMVAAWGNDGQQYVGRSLTLYRDPEVTFGGLKVGGTRISHMSHIERDMTMALTASKAQRKSYTVKKMAAPEAPRGQSGQHRAPDAGLDALKDRARLAAQQGTVTFREFWNLKDVKPHWDALRPLIDEYQRMAKAADARGAPTEADPFSSGGEGVRLDDDGEVDDGTGDLIENEPREREPGEEG